MKSGMAPSGRTSSDMRPWGYSTLGPKNSRDPAWANKMGNGHTGWSDPDSRASGQMGSSWEGARTQRKAHERTARGISGELPHFPGSS